MASVQTKMTLNFDFIFLPIVRQPEHDQGVIPGFLVAEPPKRSARGRAEDHLFLRLTLGGNAVIEIDEQTRLLEKAVQVYFKDSGAVTGALRKLVDSVNQEILNRNVQNTGRGLQTVGYLTVGVIRPDRMYLMQSGPTHALISTPQGGEHYYDPHLSGRGLGLGRTVQMRYLQLVPEAGDLILLSTQPSPAWTPEFLQNRRESGLESLRRSLIAQVEIDPFALLIQARPGSGRLRIARPKPVALVQEQAELPQPIPEPEVTSQPSVNAEPPAKIVTAVELAALESIEAPSEEFDIGGSQIEPALAEEAKDPALENVPDEEILPPTVIKDSDTPGALSDKDATVESTVDAETQESSKKPPLSLPKIALGSYILGMVRSIDNGVNALGRGTRSFLQRLLPDDAFLNFPTSVMIFFAVAIPLVVVAVAWTVYAQRGRASVYDDYLAQATAIIAQAEGETDLNQLRQIYIDSLTALDRAEQERVTEQSSALRSQVQGAYDQLEWIERVDFQPAIFGGLDIGVLITRIVALDDDLYLLDGSTGNVIHAEETTRGFEIDPSFLCGPGLQNGPLVDISSLPRLGIDESLTEGGDTPQIVGIDANGNLLYCRPDGPPISTMLPPPDSNWGRVEAMRVDSETMYVLDPVTNAVWYYPGNQSLFIERPGFYFDEDVPELRDTIDMAVDRTDLYLLKNTSEIIYCVFSNLPTALTRCDEPANFADARPGKTGGATIEGAQFTQIQFSPPPEPSIYLLDGPGQAVYHFSVRLNLQRQYRSRIALPDAEATAFVVGPNRRLFMALGDQLYYAVLP